MCSGKKITRIVKDWKSSCEEKRETPKKVEKDFRKTMLWPA